MIRNAGGLVTEDAIRSLMLSQRLLGTQEICVIQHTGCGLLDLREEELRAKIEAEVGEPLGFELGSFSDLGSNVRRSLRALRYSPLLIASEVIRGFIYDVATGTLEEVTA